MAGAVNVVVSTSHSSGIPAPDTTFSQAFTFTAATPPVVTPPVVNPPVINPPVINPPVIDPPVTRQVIDPTPAPTPRPQVSKNTGQLAATGSTLLPTAVAATLAITIGAGFLLLRRRRTET